MEALLWGCATSQRAGQHTGEGRGLEDQAFGVDRWAMESLQRQGGAAAWKPFFLPVLPLRELASIQVRQLLLALYSLTAATASDGP